MVITASNISFVRYLSGLVINYGIPMVQMGTTQTSISVVVRPKLTAKKDLLSGSKVVINKPDC
jgi:hypothetical protein